MFSIPAHAFAVPIKIEPADIDQLNHVNNVVYFRWVQEVATAHWESLTSPQQRAQWLWVVRRHEIDYLRPTFAGDEVTAFTWVVPAEQPGSDRIIVFKNMKTDKVLTQVKTTWYLIDPASMRSKKIPDEVFALFGISSI
jgi:acyl-CoA thioester hydrolase